MNWSEISKRYKEIGLSLIEKTNEGTRGLKDGLGKGQQDYRNIIRTHKILLRTGFEFLIKSLYLIKGWNIYEIKIESPIKFEKLEKINESNFNLNKTINFARLIDSLDLILLNNSDLSFIKEKLHLIRIEGNDAVHKDEAREDEIQNMAELKNKILALIQV